ncbi:MAG: DUF3073 domain-containing protein, partial [Pseudonocardiales bacterium]
SSPTTDLAALQRELSGDNGDSHHLDAVADEAVVDEYGEYRR